MKLRDLKLVEEFADADGRLLLLPRLHDLHHHRQVVNFGISTTIWDRLFGTFEPTNEPATNYFFWSTIRSYWMKLTCKPSATS